MATRDNPLSTNGIRVTSSNVRPSLPPRIRGSYVRNLFFLFIHFGLVSALMGLLYGYSTCIVAPYAVFVEDSTNCALFRHKAVCESADRGKQCRWLESKLHIGLEKGSRNGKTIGRRRASSLVRSERESALKEWEDEKKSPLPYPENKLFVSNSVNFVRNFNDFKESKHDSSYDTNSSVYFLRFFSSSRLLDPFSFLSTFSSSASSSIGKISPSSESFSPVFLSNTTPQGTCVFADADCTNFTRPLCAAGPRRGICWWNADSSSCQHHVGMDAYDLGVFASARSVGGMAGALAVGPLADRLGRKRLIILTGVVGVLSSVFMHFGYAIYLFPVTVVGRALSGVASGAGAVVGPLFVNEMIAPGYRASLGTCMQLFVCFGSFLASAIGLALDPARSAAGGTNPRFGLRVQMLIAAQTLISFFIVVIGFAVPESTVFLKLKYYRRVENAGHGIGHSVGRGYSADGVSAAHAANTGVFFGAGGVEGHAADGSAIVGLRWGNAQRDTEGEGGGEKQSILLRQECDQEKSQRGGNNENNTVDKETFNDRSLRTAHLRPISADVPQQFYDSISSIQNLPDVNVTQSPRMSEQYGNNDTSASFTKKTCFTDQRVEISAFNKNSFNDNSDDNNNNKNNNGVSCVLPNGVNLPTGHYSLPPVLLDCAKDRQADSNEGDSGFELKSSSALPPYKSFSGTEGELAGRNQPINDFNKSTSENIYTSYNELHVAHKNAALLRNSSRSSTDCFDQHNMYAEEPFYQGEEDEEENENEIISTYSLADMFIPLVVATALAVASQLTGIMAIMNYAPQITGQLGVNRLLGNFLLMTWNAVVAPSATFLATRVSLRHQCLVCLTISFFALLSVAVTSRPGVVFTSVRRGVGLAGVCLYIFAFQAGVGSSYYTLCLQIFPLSFRKFGAAYANACAFLFNTLVCLLYPLAVSKISKKSGDKNLGMSWCFFFFAICGAASLAVLFPWLKPWEQASHTEDTSRVREKDVADAQRRSILEGGLKRHTK